MKKKIIYIEKENTLVINEKTKLELLNIDEFVSHIKRESNFPSASRARVYFPSFPLNMAASSGWVCPVNSRTDRVPPDAAVVSSGVSRTPSGFSSGRRLPGVLRRIFFKPDVNG